MIHVDGREIEKEMWLEIAAADAIFHRATRTLKAQESLEQARVVMLLNLAQHSDVIDVQHSIAKHYQPPDSAAMPLRIRFSDGSGEEGGAQSHRDAAGSTLSAHTSTTPMSILISTFF